MVGRIVAMVGDSTVPKHHSCRARERQVNTSILVQERNRVWAEPWSEAALPEPPGSGLSSPGCVMVPLSSALKRVGRGAFSQYPPRV